MVSAIVERVGRFKTGLARVAIDQTVNWAHRSPRFREWMLDRLADNLGKSYQDTARDQLLLAMQIWFGRSLRPFARRLIQERPRAAQALVRLAYVWSRDVRRRTANAQQQAGVTPCTVVVEPTSRCNLNCPGCYAKSTSQGEDMSYEILRDTIAECRDMGATLITLSGGEPFLRERQDRAITRLAAEFPDLGFLTYTNGLLIDEAVARQLGEVGNVFPAISVEGGEVESDRRRGSGYYRRTSAARRLLAAHEVMYGFSATVTRQNLDLVVSEKFIDERIAEGDLFGWYFLLQPIGRNPDVNLMVTAEQRAHMREQLYRFRAEGKPIFIGDFWNDGQFVAGCMAGGKYYFHIYANGDISPCVFSPVACGNMHDILAGRSEYTSLGDLVMRHPFFRGFREQQRKIHDWRAPCVLIDHPQLFRELCQRYAGQWYPAKNMPEGYLDGEIAQALDEISQAWQERLRSLPLIPDCVARTLPAVPLGEDGAVAPCASRPR